MESGVCAALHEKEFHTFGFAVKETEEIELNVYGCDGIQALNLCGIEKYMQRTYTDLAFKNISTAGIRCRSTL